MAAFDVPTNDNAVNKDNIAIQTALKASNNGWEISTINFLVLSEAGEPDR